MFSKIAAMSKHPINCLRAIQITSRAYSSASSIDKNEIDFFSKQFKNWWDETGSMKPLHSMNALRVPFIRDGLLQLDTKKRNCLNETKPLDNFKILDAGCGAGILAESLARIGANMTGVDASSDLIELAKAHMQQLHPELKHNLTYESDSIENHCAKYPEAYDAVITSEVLEHVTNKEMFLESCVNCLKPGGSIFVTTLSQSTASWFFGIVLAENIFRMLPKGTHQHDKFIKPHQVQRILEDNNCRTVIVHGMTYNPIMNIWCWTSNTDINYALHATKI